MDHLLLHPHPSTTTAARHFVTDWARRHGLAEDTVDVLELLTSEVVANSVVHGGGHVLVSVGAGSAPSPEPDPDSGCGGERGRRAPTGPLDGTVLVCVSDAGPGRPRVRALTREDTHGRGLAMVDLLARSWGVSARAVAGACYPSPPLVAAGLGGGTGGKSTWFLVGPSTA